MLDVKDFKINDKYSTHCHRIRDIVWTNDLDKKILDYLNKYPVGSNVLFITDDRQRSDFVSGVVRTMKSKGYAVTEVVLDSKSDEYDNLSAKPILEVANVINCAFALGGQLVSKLTRYACSLKNMEYVMIPTEPSRDYLLPYCQFVINGLLCSCYTNGNVYIVNYDKFLKYQSAQTCADAYADYYGFYIDIIEYYFQTLVSSTTSHILIEEALKKLSSGEFDIYDKDDDTYVIRLHQRLLELSLIFSYMADVPSVYDTFVYLLKRLKIGQTCEHCKIISFTILITLYSGLINMDFIDLVIPANVNEEAKKMCKALNLNYNKFFLKLNQSTEQEFIYADFLIKEYSKELKAVLPYNYDIENIGIIYRRFLPDAGYGMRRFCTANEIIDILPMLSLLCPKETFIRHMGEKGHMYFS